MNCLGQDYLGTWEYTSSLIIKTNKQYINICCKDSYKKLYISIDSNQKCTGYESESQKIIFKNNNLTKIPDKYYDTILSVNADTLRILDAENYISIYIRIPHKLYDSLLMKIKYRREYSNDRRNPDDVLIFTNSINPNKRIIYSPNSYAFTSFTLFDSVEYTSALTTYNGAISNFDSNNIYLNYFRLNILTNIDREGNYIQHYYFSNNDSTIQLKIKDIKYCEIQTNKFENIANWGGIFIASGIATSLVLAPLVSINYHNFNFNSKRYYHWALAGLGATGIGLTLNLTHQPRRIDILQPNETPAKNKWRVQYYKK